MRLRSTISTVKGSVNLSFNSYRYIFFQVFYEVIPALKVVTKELYLELCMNLKDNIVNVSRSLFRVVIGMLKHCYSMYRLANLRTTLGSSGTSCYRLVNRSS